MPARPTPNVTHPGGYAAGRKLVLEGETYEFGEQIPDVVVARCRNVNALLSRRWIIPVTKEHIDRARHPKHLLTPTPTHLHHTEVRAHLKGNQ